MSTSSERPRLIVGIDFDNTIVLYDRLFAGLCRERGILRDPAGCSKFQLRELVRAQPDGENLWQQLQAEVYGRQIHRAEAAAGVAQAIGNLRARGAAVCIISHKSQHPAADPRLNLWDAAWQWLDANGFTGKLVEPQHIFFEPTRVKKIQRIVASGCDVFVDDLIEVLQNPGLPGRTKKILFGEAAAADGCDYCSADWREIEAYIQHECL